MDSYQDLDPDQVLDPWMLQAVLEMILKSDPGGLCEHKESSDIGRVISSSLAGSTGCPSIIRCVSVQPQILSDSKDN